MAAKNRLSLNGQDIGVLTHYSGGKNISVFSPDYLGIMQRWQRLNVKPLQ